MNHSMKQSLRMLIKYRLFSGITIFGLTIAISSTWFIANYVKHSYKYDAFHQNYNRIYRLSMEVIAGGSTNHYAITGKPLGKVMYQNYTGIEAYAKMTYHSSIVKVNGDIYNETGFFSINPQALEVFSFDFISGGSFSNPNSILLSRALAEKYFNSIDVVGKQLAIGEHHYTVGGVFANWPGNTHLDINALLYSEESENYDVQDWFDLEQYNYILLEPLVDQAELEVTLADMSRQVLDPQIEASGIEVKFHSEPLEGLYFAPGLIDDVPKGSRSYINTLTLAAFLVLLIAGLNYINMSLTQSTLRTKEFAMKKILGISRKQLFLQSGIESVVMTVLILIISFTVIAIFDPLFFDYAGFRSLTLEGNWWLLLTILLITFLFGLIGSSFSGVYQSFSSRMISQEGAPVRWFKKTLLGFQIAISSVILMLSLTMNKQIDFMKNTDLGFSKEQVLILPIPDNEELRDRRIHFMERLKNISGISVASLVGGGALPGEENGKEIFELMIEGNRVEKIYTFYRIDDNYCKLLDIPIVMGRDFEAHSIRDQNESAIINESLAKSLDWDNPLGQTIWYGGTPREVIGVVKNFHNKSLHNLIEPIVFLFDNNYSSNLIVKAASPEVGRIKSAWTDYFPDIPFSLTYFEDFIDDMYAKENHLVQLLNFFSIISLVLCCMGLFAIFSLHIYQTTKDMCIRKVLGANVFNLFKSATKSYVTITAIAIGAAIPAAWLLSNSWLDRFSYKIQINPILFAGSALLVLMVSFGATMAYHLYKVITVNPIDSLSHE